MLYPANFYPRPPRGGRPAALSNLSAYKNFYPRPPRGGRPVGKKSPAGFCDFYPRPPRGGRPGSCTCAILVLHISIHALREEGDEAGNIMKPQYKISIHALREEGDWRADRPYPRIPISIHALREEGDPPQRAAPGPAWYFYPRPPRGGRPKLCGVTHMAMEFLSTPSARRATILLVSL